MTVNAMTVLVLWIVGILVVFLRLSPSDRGILWAEDGSDFLATAFTGSLFENFTAPYAGYMHAYPRLAAEFVAQFVPLEDAGYGLNLFGAAAWSLAATTAFWFSRTQLTMPLRVVLWSGVLLVPIGSLEVATNVANSHWFLMFAAFWALLVRGYSVIENLLASLVVALAILSDPLTLCFAPLVVLRILAMPGLRRQVVSGAFCIAAIVQVAVVLSTTRARDAATPTLSDLGETYLIRVVWQSILGPTWGSVAYSRIGHTLVLVLALICTIALLAAAAVALKKRAVPTIALVASMAFFVVVHFLTWGATGAASVGQEVYWGGRYLVVPSLLLLSGAVVLLDGPISRLLTSPRSRPVGALLLIGLALIVLVPGIHDFQNEQYKHSDSSLAREIRLGNAACAADDIEFYEFTITPAAFKMAVPCSHLTNYG